MFQNHALSNRLFSSAALVLVALLLISSQGWARTIKSVKIKSISQRSVSCGSSTSVVVELLVKVPNNFVGPETGTVEIWEDDGAFDDLVGSGTYTVTATMINAQREATVTSTISLTCYAANADCECDFGNRPGKIDDDHDDHTIYAKDKASGHKSPKNALVGNYVDIISCLKTGGKLAMAYPSYMQLDETILISMGYEFDQSIDKFDWTFAADERYFSITRAWFASAVGEAFDAAIVDFGAHRPGEVQFLALNEIPNGVNLGDGFQMFFEVHVSPDAPYGEFGLETQAGSEIRDEAGRIVPVNHPSARLTIGPADDTAPEIDASLISFDADNLTLEGEPGAISDDYLGDLRGWVEVAAIVVGADGERGTLLSVDVPDDGHFLLDNVETEDDDIALVLVAIDLLGNASELSFDLGGAPSADGYHASVASTGDAFGAFFAIGPCGQLAGWTDVDGRGVPALNVGGDVRTFDSPSRLSHGLGVNALSWISGQYQTETGFAPFVLDPAAGFFPVPTLGGGRGVVYSLDDSSRLAVGMSTAETDTVVFEPTLWFLTSEGGEVFAEPVRLPGVGGVGGSARDVNNAGTIVGSVTGPGNIGHAVIWEEVAPGKHTVRDLGPGSAAAVNDFGVVVGSLTIRRGLDRAFYLEDGEAIMLPSPASCPTCPTVATAINSRGEILGWARPQSGAAIPLYWNLENPGAAPVDVRSLPSLKNVEARLESVSGINDAGQILAGGKIGQTPVSIVLSPIAIDSDFDHIADSCQPRETEFVRADPNNDGNVDIGDPIFVLAYLFSGGAEPSCLDASDLNDDGFIDISDAVSGLGYLFLGTMSIAAPFPACGADSTPDALGCESASLCTAAVHNEEDFVKEACAGGVSTGVLMDRHECRGGLISSVTYEGYTCPDGTFLWVEHTVVPTQIVCP